MTNKLMFGLAAASSAGLFWACGSGDILEIQQSDKFVEYALVDDSTAVDGYVQRALAQYCGGNEECMKASQPGRGSGNTAVSSSSAGPTSPYAASSSSATNNQQQQQTPISSGNVSIVSSPSQQTPTSSPNLTPVQTASSSSAAPVNADPNAWGTCAANASNNAIQKGKSVQWKVSLDNNKAPGGVSIITQGTFSWTFEDGDPATKSGQGSSFQSVLVKYDKSGLKNASVTVSYNGQSNTMQCTPLNVTGAEVSGCVCTPSATEVDVAVNGTVTWTVSGCKSSDPTYAYEWSDGLQGTNAAGGVLTAKGTYAPTVTVKNSDNGMQVVTCGAVTAVDANNPDYVIKQTQGTGAIKLPAGKTNVSLEVDAYNNQVFCQVARTDSPSGQITGTVNNVAISGADYVTASMAAGSLKKGASLLFDLSVPATCGVQ
jgi:hypothetical protein